MLREESTKKWFWIALASAAASMVIFAAATSHARSSVDRAAQPGTKIPIKHLNSDRRPLPIPDKRSRYQSSFDAIRAPSAIDWNFAQVIFGSTA